MNVRRILTILSLVGCAACAKEGAPAGPSQSAKAPTPSVNIAPAPAAPANVLTLVCDGRSFARDTTIDTIRNTFGTGNVTVGAPDEGFQDVWVFANDPRRAIDVRFVDDGGGLRLESAQIMGTDSEWVLPGGLKIGDNLETVERYNGKPFGLWGFGGDNGGASEDWNGGAMQAATNPDCTYFVNFSQQHNAVSEGSHVQSDDAAVRALKPKISGFGITLKGAG